MRLRGGKFFQVLKICLQLSAVCLQFSKKSTASQTHLDVTNIRSKVHRFSSTAIYFWQFSFRMPCKHHFFCFRNVDEFSLKITLRRLTNVLQLGAFCHNAQRLASPTSMKSFCLDKKEEKRGKSQVFELLMSCPPLPFKKELESLSNWKRYTVLQKHIKVKEMTVFTFFPKKKLCFGLNQLVGYTIQIIALEIETSVCSCTFWLIIISRYLKVSGSTYC